MVFLFIFLIVFIIFICILIFSKIRIEIINFKFTSMNKRHLNENYKIIIKLSIFNKFTIFKIILTKNKIKSLNLKQKAKVIKTRIIENKSKFDKKIFKVMKNLNIDIKKLNLNIDIGTENASLTALLVGIISSITGIVFRKNIIDNKKQSFRILPIYINKNLINISVSGIFEIKMIHIINIIYVLNKKEGVKKNERTSNRRTYDYSYE